MTVEERGRYAAGMVTGALRTPLVLQDGVWVKLEYLNPIGRAKDRVAGIALAYRSARSVSGR